MNRKSILALFGSIYIILQTSLAQTKVFYEADTSLFANPETGPMFIYSHTGTKAFMPPLGEGVNTLINYRLKYGFSTVFYSYYIGEWKRKDLPQNILDRIDADMSSARLAGYKVIPHFHYAYEYTYDPRKFIPPFIWSENELDAKREIIVRHCSQLKPVLQKNADVIAFMGWGMIGPWGEMWCSGSWNVGDSTANLQSIGSVNDNTRAIIEAELEATPGDRMITFVPTGKRELYGNMPLSAKEAFTGTDKSRMGFINQCFLTDVTAADPTYKNNEYRGPRSYLEKDGLYVPQIAFVDVNCGYTPLPEQLLEELNTGHWDLVEGTGLVKEVLSTNLDDPKVTKFFTRFGYRYQLKTSNIQATAAPGTEVEMELELSNINGGSLYNPRGIEIILRNVDTKLKHVFPIEGDKVQNRLYFPKPFSDSTWQISFRLPSDMAEGNYEVLLNLPDPYPSLHDLPEYSIRLANKNTWEAKTGYNSLNANLKVDKVTNTKVAFSKSSLTVHPNPVKKILHIDADIFEGMDYEIISIDGRLMQRGSVSEHAISIESLEPGFYIIKLQTEAGESVQRFVKE